MNSYPQELSTGGLNLWTTLRSRAQVIHMIDSYLTRSVRFALSTRAGVPGSSRRTSLLSVLCIAMLLPYPAHANQSKEIQLIKLYAYTRLIDSKQFHCLDLLWTRESHWNSKAKNKHSSAFGIPQLLKMKEKDPFKQVDLGLKYIVSRYSNPCLAWSHWSRVGHY
jgi:hypothetical protein